MSDRIAILPAQMPSLSRAGDHARWGQVRGAALPLAIARLAAVGNRSLLVLTGSVGESEQLADQIAWFRTGGPEIRLFPDAEVLPYDSFSPHQDLVSQRLRMLRRLTSGTPTIILAALPSLLHRLPPQDYLQARSFALAAGQRLDPATFRAGLEASGYQRVSQVAMHGEFAVRGSLVDFFPSGHECPVRVDFLDDQIESLREFDPDSQVSTGRIAALDTLPARELPIDAEAIREFRQRFRARFEGNPTRCQVYREVSEGRLPPGIETYLPLFFESTASFWDYLPDATLVVSTVAPEPALAHAWQAVADRYEQARHDVDRPVLRPEELFVTEQEHRDALSARPMLELVPGELPDAQLDTCSANLPVNAAPTLLINRRDDEPARRLQQFVAGHGGRILFSAESPGRRELLLELLRDADLHPASFADWPSCAKDSARHAIVTAPLDKGFVLADGSFALLTEAELLGEQPKRRRRQRRVQDPESLINDLTDLRPGAPVVHADHGVGRYVGLTHLDIDAALTEFVTLEYAGGDLLHVPVSALHLISRYTGAAPEHAPLHRLGTDQWARAKRRAADKIRDVAAELLELYARRAARLGHPARLDEHDYEAFAAGFPFTLTDDQAQAVDAVLADLTSSSPMDRLVCGDVGFGKTEVALRAAFVAVADGRQVAVLVPTTLLAQQHYQTFADRFADWPVRVEQLSRFRNAADTRAVQAGLADGSVDIVIGTHRLLQAGMSFKNLGLIIVDEEHRFGVRHKEKLKTLRAEVDILTLTATPIPRTLNMALGGLRELSLITTPPESRLSIKTFVVGWQDHVIREACQRELQRGGQVYFVHNRIEDIDRVAQQLAELLPDARIEVAHGQMRERDLERIMLDFYHRRFHILVCTAIIESGLDVPSANTIIINRADRFGLAQLHQLRGRVGRSHHQAFAYLLAPPREALTADAGKRLEAIESLEDLGAGFVLATHDLEIRGAGELLGEEQSGQIQEIGFSLYNEILSRTIESLRDGLEPDPEAALTPALEINLHLPALIPEDYMPDVHLRLVHYKRIASAADDAALEALQIELIDRFGLIPQPTANLFRITALRLRAAPLGLKRIDLGPGGGRVEFGPQTSVDPGTLVGLLESRPHVYRLDAQQRLKITADLESDRARFDMADELLTLLSQTAGSRRASA
jgi:transcription-repair coupling factor (superfamily II helicase)